jgi:hypothetical protein
MNMLAHSIFVLKYWIVSKKIEAMVSNKNDKYVGLKANAIFGILIVLILSTGCYYSFN